MAKGYSSAVEAAEAFGWNVVTYRAHENGSRGIKPDLARKYARAFGVSAEHILFNRESSGSAQLTRSDDEHEEKLAEIPILGFKAGAGGGGIALDDEPVGYLPIERAYLRRARLDAADLVAFEIEGDSMDDTLHSGDRVMANKNDRNPARGGIFAIFDSDTIVVKRVEKIPNSNPVMLRLISDNKNHSAYDVIAEDTNIIGRVVWLARRL